jgi:hypothetical protein
MLERITSLLRPKSDRHTLRPGGVAVKPAPAGEADSGGEAALEPTVRRVLGIVYDPVIDGKGRTLRQEMGWYDPPESARQYADDVREASHGLLDYRLVDWVERDAYFTLTDGFAYDAETFSQDWRSRSPRNSEWVDYVSLVREHQIVQRVNADEIDDVWFFGYPWSGFYESIMGGPGAFWCNAPPLALPDDLPAPQRRFVVMGFNYEREVGCMLEDLGHQAESIMTQVYRHRRAEANVWQRFTRYDQIAPGHASCGNVHFAPNSERDYDWGNRRPVTSDCDDWLEFPHLTGRRRTVDCRDWGSGDMREHHLWWFRRIPHAPGTTSGIANNWWRYIGNPDNVD